MVRRIKDFIRYTAAELENYTKAKNSCVKKLNKKLHLNFPPYGLASFKTTLLKLISEKKIGSYDTDVDGIILDIRNIKVLGDIGAIRFDDSFIHINIQADCYVFQPKIGSVVQGLVKHISQRQIGVIIYRVFSVPIRLSDTVSKSSIALNSEIEFRIKKYDLQNTMPYIEGELMSKEVSINTAKNSIKFFDDDEEEVECNEKDENNVFKKPDEKKEKKKKKSACEILADSENEEIVFSELSYLNDEEVRKLKEPKHRKKLNSESSSSEVTAKQNISPKHSLKKIVRFEDASDNSSLETDYQNLNISSRNLKKIECQSTISNHDETDEIIKQDQKFNESLESSSESDNEYSKKTNSKNDYQNNNDKVKTEMQNIYSSDSEDDKDNVLNEIKNIKSTQYSDLVSNIEKKPQINLGDSSDSNSDIEENVSPRKEHNFDNEIKSENESDDERFVQSILQEDRTNLIKVEPVTPTKNDIETKPQIKIESESPIKMNGYESEDLFKDHLETPIPPNQNMKPITKKKKERKISLVEEINVVLENTIKQRKMVESSPAYSTQKEIRERTDKSSVKSTSDTSFNEAFKEILEKSKRKKLSESDSSNFGFEISSNRADILNDTNSFKKKSKSQKKRKNSLETSMAEILKCSMESKLKEIKLSQEFDSSDTIKVNNNKSNEETSKKKSRKRKISLNDSINDVLAKMIKEKSNESSINSPSKKLKN